MRSTMLALKQHWAALARREKLMVAAATAVVAIAALWILAIAPALATLQHSDEQRRVLDAQLQRIMALRAQAQSLQSQPKQNYEEASRQLELSVRQGLGTSARLSIQGERATVTLTGTAPDALAQWLAQARANARAIPAEAHLVRNGSGMWEGNVVLTLPART
jgi:general secretion pathway protein M